MERPSKMPKTILVTGANRGIGFAIVKSLAQRSETVCILVASRMISSAYEAVSDIRKAGLEAGLQPIELDVTKDNSIKACLREIEAKFGKIDVLINNAGIASNPENDLSDFRAVYNQILDTNVTSAGLLTSLCMPLLRKSTEPRVINISSGRASIHNITSGNLPPTASIPYSVSKVALNILTLEMAKTYMDVDFYAANPGHCKTAFNGYRGAKDPLEGAKVVVELAMADKNRFKPGFWKCEDSTMSEMHW